ncbi:MAG: putative deacetylase sulfotransferase, partial [uncultured Chloroflexia bacterium]
FDVEVGATRSAASNSSRRRLQDQEIKTARQQINKQRRELARQEREITRLRMELSAASRLGQDVKAEEARWEIGSQQSGALPDFLIVGAQKCGTTFLYHLLNQHLNVAPASTKEVHYFDVHFAKGEDWYRSHFSPPSWRKGRRSITGEASPYYLFHPHAARRAANTVPKAKLISLLRNPVDRAYSDYKHKAREGRDPLSFEKAIEAEEGRLRGEREKMLADESYLSPNHRKFSYLSRGIYVDQLIEWCEYFDQDQMLVLNSEAFFADPLESLGPIFKFLGLPSWEPELQSIRANSNTRHEGTYGRMSPDIRRRLETYFEPHNRRLYNYLDVDFGW